jgi:hypothetical protein
VVGFPLLGIASRQRWTSGEPDSCGRREPSRQTLLHQVRHDVGSSLFTMRLVYQPSTRTGQDTLRTGTHYNALQGRWHADGTDTADTGALQVHQSSDFLNRVHWFDSGRGHCREPVSEAASRPISDRTASPDLAFVYQDVRMLFRPCVLVDSARAHTPPGHPRLASPRRPNPASAPSGCGDSRTGSTGLRAIRSRSVSPRTTPAARALTLKS